MERLVGRGVSSDPWFLANSGLELEELGANRCGARCSSS